MHTLPPCPVCSLENTYQDNEQFICPDCGHEWITTAQDDDDAQGDGTIRDSNGNPLADGDAVILIKDLKVKGSSIVLKKGTKVKSIRLGNGTDGHEVDCKMEGGSFMLKASFLKKA
jgi:protein PhnA